MPARYPQVGGLGELVQSPDFHPPGMSDPVGGPMRFMALGETRRAKNLKFAESFFEGRQHGHLKASWYGQPRDPGVNYLWERTRPQGYVPTNAVPYGDRKPNAPAPTGLKIVSRFSEMLLGEGRAPSLDVPADADTSAFLGAIMDESDCWDTLAEGRDKAGSCGCSAFLLEIYDGAPAVTILDPSDLEIVKWKRGRSWVPVDVIEQRVVSIRGADVVRTRRWTETTSYTYEDVPLEQVRENPDMEIRVNGEIPHHAGRCPVVWYQNIRNTKFPESRPDYGFEPVYQLMDRVDRLQSMIGRTVTANVDPTLVKADDPMHTRREGPIQKGHGHVIKTTPKGKVYFLETRGESVEMASRERTHLIRQIEDAVGIVDLEPGDSAMRSGEAIQQLWRRMEAACNRRRTALTDAIRQIGRIWISLASHFGVSSIEDPVEGTIALPPRVTESVDDDGQIETEIAAYEVGEGRYIHVLWPPYHYPTSAQVQQLAQGLAVATAQKQVLSQETGVAVLTNALGRGDPKEELRRIEQEDAAKMAAFDALQFPDDGDGDGGGDEEQIPAKRPQASTEPDGDGDDDGDGGGDGDGEERPSDEGAVEVIDGTA